MTPNDQSETPKLSDIIREYGEQVKRELTDLHTQLATAQRERDEISAFADEETARIKAYDVSSAKLRAEVEELRASAKSNARDRERLDWLETQPIFIDSRVRKSWEQRLSYQSPKDKRTLRVAIDAAMQAKGAQ